MKIFIISTLIALLVSSKVGSVAADSYADKDESNLRRQTWSTNTDCGTAKCPRGYICDTYSNPGNPMCIPCGHTGEPCCDDEDSKCAYHGLFCDLFTMPTEAPLGNIRGGVMSGSCQKCGRPGGVCCEGNKCQGPGYVCSYYEKIRTGDGSGATGAAPSCQACGGPGEHCCYEDAHLQCGPGLVCDQTSDTTTLPRNAPICKDNTDVPTTP
mmetsp:Transcript_8103/g.17532  ORF Transcript_8103/g.17532 Transcript_8103/m.17532 type:complete len:211 (+) Transcript_8103:125-757(+)|eukprot:CAMPEP_0178496178 /NCGR_PEP_ID=MMETSP0696-20121128/13969_1 /TAXON_ID=265572 /ORGANISM="Extubocellulus spinifer, Strain CCMP396" /LENGTH=210 /DNA_ID=CAMNT_0020124425 /DNA_START=103 /DNA_END=735 /DNA_ORIENTATION=-